MRLLGAMWASSMAPEGGSSLSDGISKAGSKNIKLVSKVLKKFGKEAEITELVASSEMWITAMEKDKNSYYNKAILMNSTWGPEHGFNKPNSKYYVSFRKLHKSRNGSAPVLINRNHPTKMYGEYELVDLYNWTNEQNKDTVLYKLKMKILSNSSRMYEFTEEALGYEVGKDNIGYYIIRNNHDGTGRNYVTYFLPNESFINITR